MKVRRVAGWAAVLGGAALTSPAAAGPGDAPVASATFQSYDAKGCVATEVTVFALGTPGGSGAKLTLVWGAPCQGQSAGGTLFPDAPRMGPWRTTGEGPPNLVSGRLASSRTLIPHPARSSAQAGGTRLLDGG